MYLKDDTSTISLDIEKLQEAVYELIIMRSISNGMSEKLGYIIGGLAEIQSSGNYYDLIVDKVETTPKAENTSSPKMITWIRDAMNNPDADIKYTYNDSFEVTKSTSKGNNFLGLQRILVKMRDLEHIIEVTQALISRTQMEMEYTDEVIARLALELTMQSASISAKEKAKIRKNRVKVLAELKETITNERLAQETEVKAMAELYGEQPEEVDGEELGIQE